MSDILLQARSELWAGAVANKLVFSARFQQAAVASQFSAAQLRNPTGSGRIYYVFSAKAFTNSTAPIMRSGPYNTTIGTANATFANLAPEFGASSVAEVGCVTTAGSPLLAFENPPMIHTITSSNISDQLSPHGVICLHPGQFWLWELITVNLALNMTVLWAELQQ